MTLEHEVRAKIAERYAAAADRASTEGDERGLLAAGEKLLELLDTLPVRSDVGGGARSGGDDERGRVLGIIHSAPVVGDAEDS